MVGICSPEQVGVRSSDYTSEYSRYGRATGNSEPSDTQQQFEVKYSEFRIINEAEDTANMSNSSPDKGKIVSVPKHHAVKAWKGAGVEHKAPRILYHAARRVSWQPARLGPFTAT
jgi:hypothetical protein